MPPPTVVRRWACKEKQSPLHSRRSRPAMAPAALSPKPRRSDMTGSVGCQARPGDPAMRGWVACGEAGLLLCVDLRLACVALSL
jgi:hypothetical protein